MYKRQADPISFPGPDRRYQYVSPSFFLIKNLIWPPDPLNKGKIDFFIAILSSVKLLLQEYIKKNVQTPSRKAKNTAAGTNILPPKAKALLSPPPQSRILAFYTWVPGAFANRLQRRSTCNTSPPAESKMADRV